MSQESLPEKLQQAYNDTLDTIENLINNEGKSVREAFFDAQEKLSEWGELTREEADSISDEIQRDLREMGETLHGAHTSFREQIRLEARYLAESAWDKLSSIADTSTLQLIQFKETLEENVREMTTESHGDPHKEHQDWEKEHALWLDEIKHWQKEHEDIDQRVESVRQAFDTLDRELTEHQQRILSHETLSHMHEKSMAEVEKDPSSEVAREQDQQQEALHVLEQEQQLKSRQFHQRLKQYHWRMTSLMNQLEKEIAKAPHFKDNG